MGQVGRKGETTLGIASLRFEIGALPRPVPDQFKLPARPPNAGNGHSTVAGLEFFETALRILEETAVAFRKFKARSQGESGRLTIGVSASFITGNMDATLADHRRKFPKVDLHIAE